MEERSGYPMLPLPRSDLLNVLYQHLPNKDTVLKLGTEVSDYEVSDEDVRVHLKDGTVVEGSIVVGADGVHSRVRGAMEKARRKEIPSTPATLMTASYQSIYALVPNRRGIKDGQLVEMRGSGHAVNVLASPTQLMVILYRRLPTPTTAPVRYTIDEMDQFAESFMDMTVAPCVLFRDIWGDFDKKEARLVNQEEGVAKIWHHKRTVLLGDSACKMTSASGLGLNVGLDSAALLASELQRCLVSNPDPDTRLLTDVFERCMYQRSREKECERQFSFAYNTTRTITWSSWGYWIFDRFIFRLIGMEKVAATIYSMVSDGQILSYVPFERRQTSIPWLRWPDVKPLIIERH
ncbi:hypothetical protein F5Y16DRAFT_410852 [Xylariaceae sp. FL0255]|nr:hypothetical protein F5Y16DRAFT_410852 [Xylariaceae sp. FL0255]